MTYRQAIRYLESFIDYEKIPSYPYQESLKLERIKGFLCSIGSPHESLKCVHVAGTKGKGSTCAFIAYILRESGYRVGLYTSPHLNNFRERIRVLEPSIDCATQARDFEGMISRRDLIALTEQLKSCIEKFNRATEYGPLSFFEAYTAIALVYFKKKNVDWAILETGLGGRLDATNVVNALVAVITPISLEHTQKLGNTLREIAKEKAGIIKKGYRAGDRVQGVRYPLTINHYPIVISAPQEQQARQVIRNRCDAVGVKLYEVGRHITYTAQRAGFMARGIFSTYAHLTTRLIGRHQMVNAVSAVGAVEALRFCGIQVSEVSVRTGIARTRWPGRCEVVHRHPLVILDGAQNVASAAALIETIRENFTYKRLILIFGISSDKDIGGVCAQLRDIADFVILTKAHNPRASSPEELVTHFPDKKIYLTRSIKEARSRALRLADRHDLILVCGSLFVVGEFRDGTD